MAVEIKLNPDVMFEVETAVRRGMHLAGEAVLAASNTLAPIEDEPKHGVHMVETGFVRPMAAPGEVVVGYDAFWSVWQHEDTHYKHARGEDKFLEKALLALGEAAVGVNVSAELRKVTG